MVVLSPIRACGRILLEQFGASPVLVVVDGRKLVGLLLECDVRHHVQQVSSSLAVA